MKGVSFPNTQVPPSQQIVVQSTAIWLGMSVGESTPVCCVTRADYRSGGGGFEIVMVADEGGLKSCAGRNIELISAAEYNMICIWTRLDAH